MANSMIVLLLFVLAIFLVHRVVKRNFTTLHLGPLFFFLGLAVAGYFILEQIYVFNIARAFSDTGPWLSKLLVFAIIFLGSIIVLKVCDDLIFNRYLLKKEDVQIPTLFRDIIIFTVLIIVVLVTIKVEFGIRITGILASSAVLTVIIGLALQDTLSNIIAGIVLHIERPFGMGDWIKAGDQEGRVAELSWRATRLRTIEGNFIIIPNTNIAKETILNYYKPTKIHSLTFNIGIEYKAAPNKVKELFLKSIDDCKDVLKKPAPAVYVTEFGDHAVEYEVKVWIENHAIYKNIKDDIMTKIWYRLGREKVEIPFPVRTVYLHDSDKIKAAGKAAAGQKKVKVISQVNLFRDVPEDIIRQLAESAWIKHFSLGEKIITEGDAGHSLFVIVNGNVRVTAPGPKGENVILNNLADGEYFGEMSLLTGEKRSATVEAGSDVTLLEIDADAIAPVVEKNPQLIEVMSRELAGRKLETKDIMDKASVAEEKMEKESLSKNIFWKIKDFFSRK